MSKVFISHATADAPVVDAFVDLLEAGIGVPAAEIFCSSRKGQGVPAGHDFKSYIKDKLQGSALVIALLTENYYGSAFSMCELGAVWVGSQAFVPVLVPPLGYDALKAILQGVQAIKPNDAADLDELRDLVRTKVLGGVDLGTPRWNKHRDKFLSGLGVALKQVKTSAPVSRVEYLKVKKERDEYVDAYQRQGEELSESQALCSELEALKDKEQVKVVRRKRGTGTEVENETFEELTTAVKQAFGKLPDMVIEALYHEFRGKDWMPGRDVEWAHIEAASEEGLVRISTDERQATVSATDAKKVRTAREALTALSKWLRTESSTDFDKEYEEEHDEAPDLALRGFWRSHFDHNPP